jgi:multiple sugar transport system permease protein
MTISTVVPAVPATTQPVTAPRERRGNRRVSPSATILLLLGAI